MVIRENIRQVEFVCPHCNGNSFIHIGLQRQKGLFKDRELWTCKTCHGTFARESVEIKKSAENEIFNKRAFPYYCRICF